MVAPHAPFLLQPTHTSINRPGYHEEYLRMMEQRRTMENHRGATKRCIELNTFPHKFKKVQRGKDQDDDEDDVDKCTICLCGMYFGRIHTVQPKAQLSYRGGKFSII